MKILTAEAMKGIDRAAVEEYGIPSLVLMENAAIGLADAVAESYPQATSVAIFCGPGNNGGDGLALGRHLAIRGYHVELYLLTGGREPGGDAGVQLAICRTQGLPLLEIDPDDGVGAAVEAARGLDLLVDALFGIGLTRSLEGAFAELVEALNVLPVPRLAVDLPSGLSGSSARIVGPHFEADVTVTFGAPKVAHIFPPAADAVGQVVVADLGIPPELYRRAPGGLHLLVGEELATLLVPRPAASHKGDYGHVVLMAGSVGKAGAAVLAARSAVRAGAGLVTAAVPEAIVQTVDLGSLESMSEPLSQEIRGGLDPAAVEQMARLIAGKTALGVGPGLGRVTSTVEVVRRVVLESPVPLVLDADGLNAFEGCAELLRRRAEPTVLTPHPGELGRLLGVPAAEVQKDRVAAARRGAEITGAVVVLKGFQTLVASPQGEVSVNPTGNPGMASGGTGDVLTGLILALLGQGHEADAAARLGVYLHGLAGDFAAETRGQISLAAGDLVEALPRAFERLEES